MVEAEIPAVPVNNGTEAVMDPQINAREMIVDLDHPGIGKIPVSGIVVKLSKTPEGIETPFRKLVSTI